MHEIMMAEKKEHRIKAIDIIWLKHHVNLSYEATVTHAIDLSKDFRHRVCLLELQHD